MDIISGSGLAQEDILDFADLIFSKNSRPHDFETMLPKLYAPDTIRPDRHLVAMEKGRLRAMLMYHPITLMVGDSALTVLRVGTIGVHPKCRGQGLMQQLMDAFFRLDETREADVLSLGGQRQRYEYFGFTPGGMVVRYDVIAANVRHGLAGVSPLTLMPFADKYAGEAARIMAAQPIYVKREEALFERTLSSWHGKPLAFLKDGAFAGYCTHIGDKVGEIVMADGADLQAGIKALFSHLGVDALRFEVSLWDRLNGPFSALSEHGTISWQHAYRMNQPERVIQAFLSAAHLQKPLPHGSFALPISSYGTIHMAVDAHGVHVSKSGGDAGGCTMMEAFRRLFTPCHGFLPMDAPAGWFPLPLFIPLADVC